MATANTSAPDESPLVNLSVLVLLAGAGGMVISFTFLASDHHLDVIAGAVGFLAGVILVAVGWLSLAVQSRSPVTSQAAIRAAGCLVGLLPPAVAALAWPTLFFGAGLAVLLMPLVLLGCLLWAWLQSPGVAGHLTEFYGSRRVRLFRAVVFVAQALAIVATWPLFGYFLRVLESMGYKFGWP
jgi:hypothetical protein